MSASPSSAVPHPPEQVFTVRSRRLTLRQLGPADAARLQEFFYSHTLETIQLRYGHAVTRMTSERAYDLVNVDQNRDLALAIFEEEGPRTIIHAVGRYYLDPGERSAEAAFVVRESLRQLGLGRRLMKVMVDTARERGLELLWGRVRRDNQPMLGLFRRFGGQLVAGDEPGDSDVEIRVPLQAPKVAPPSRTARPGLERGSAKSRRKRNLC